MGFEVFSRKSAARTKDPTMTIQRKGILSLSPAAVALLVGDVVQDQYKVELLFDRERQIVALRLASESNPNPHLLRKQGRSEVYLVSGKLFTAYYGIETKQARRYVAREYDSGIVGICLTDDFAEVGRRVKRRDKSSVDDGVDATEDE